MTDTAPRTTPADKRRGDAILATMQAQRAYCDQVPNEDRSTFDEAHAIVERLVAGGFIDLKATGKAAA